MKVKLKFLVIIVLFWLLGGIASASSPYIIEWQKVIGGSGTDIPWYDRSIQQTSDGGYILGSNSDSINGDASGGHGSVDFWVIKLNPMGSIQWQKLLGGSSQETFSSIQQTNDGGYILSGRTTSSNSGDVGPAYGGGDMWVVKLNPIGDIQWQRVLGGSNDEGSYSIQQTTGGGYISCGYTTSNNNGDVGTNHGGYDFWVVKLYPTGDIEWQNVLGGSAYYDNAFSCQQTSEGGYVVTGSTESSNDGDVGSNHGGKDVWVVKLFPAGDIQWQKVLGGNGFDSGRSIQQTNDGGYILTGITESNNNGDVGSNHGGGDVWVVKLYQTGDIQWQKVLGGNDHDAGMSIQQTYDGGFILSGQTKSSNSGDVGFNHGDEDAWVVKLNPTGDIEWQKVLGGNNYENGGQSIKETTDGGYIFTGYTSSSNSGDIGTNHGGYDIWVVKLGPTPLDTQSPRILNFIAAPSSAPINTPVILNADIDDTSTGGSRIKSAEYSLDDSGWVFMSAVDGSFDTSNEKVSFTLPSFISAGIYNIKIRATDANDNTGESSEIILLPVYDPTGGFVTGGGWFNSPVGAYVPDHAITGKASFGFVSKYKKGATVPTGETEFIFKVADLNFHSESYDWLVVAGPKAQYKGIGTINGQGEYAFMLTAIDGAINGGGGLDKFRIKIWDKVTDARIYDNQLDAPDKNDPTTALAGGSIIIHK